MNIVTEAMVTLKKSQKLMESNYSVYFMEVCDDA